ncbi:MAG: phosphatase PAP2 family protein [Nevskia sp.]|jgi:membrane-associated phospholipid phosphatase|uniref:phosphatase PAP2 family protein n=1 Tax=Nevskia sp. TaxID=1929292 RepID=UPI0040372702
MLRARRTLLALLSAAALAVPLRSVADANRDQLTLSNWLKFVPAAGAAAYSGYRGDSTGLWQLGGELAATVAATQALKYAFKDGDWGTRPDGGSKSFPSGHTSTACAGAAYLGERYGWQQAAPAYAVSAWVAYIRVNEDKHYVRDVVAGCALAYGLSKLIVKPWLPAQVSLLPVLGPGEVGLTLSANW